MLLGAGLGGFVDGILLHQILQWHHMLTERGYGLTVQTLADGLFHAATWLAVTVGLWWLWRRVRLRRPRPYSALAGPMLAGWGLFNLIEGIVDHHLLAVHHVRSGEHQLAWDLAFLGLGAVLLIAGWLLHRDAIRRDRVPPER
ncbi:DUF2243 domain-containing protein [Allorhizocola rhizosphaerae]|uniref:DUF2243 domain-containing protein n=1 Tax=Allorhizocola rhizosphaerae TaxID=1872709 RepID=UPI001FE566EC|nr:DUF2243 domain-containing protein [Allorhizocola rhizosphaerae]